MLKTADTAKIPKIIHYCWFGGTEMPEKNLKCIASWKKYCPDYEIKRWDETNYDINKNSYMKQAYEAKKWGFVPDYARLDIIYNNGGIYLDTDVEIIKNIDILLQNKAFMGFESPQFVALGLGFGAVKGNLHIKAMRDAYNGMEFVNQDGSYNMLPSPNYSTEYLLQIGLVRDGSKQMLDEMLILPTEYLCPKDYETGKLNITEKTYSIHHYDASWQSEYERKLHNVQIMLKQKFSPKVANTLFLLYRKSNTLKKILKEKDFKTLKGVLKRRNVK